MFFIDKKGDTSYYFADLLLKVYETTSWNFKDVNLHPKNKDRERFCFSNIAKHKAHCLLALPCTLFKNTKPFCGMCSTKFYNSHSVVGDS